MPEARVIGHPETEEGCITEAGIAPLVRLGGGGTGRFDRLRHAARTDSGEVARRIARLRHVRPAGARRRCPECLEPLEDEVGAWPGGTILLPHSREMAQLLGQAPEEIEADPLAAVRRASERFNAVALVKGSYSFAAEPGGRAFRLKGGGVGLATSGSGDVLAGIVGGLCARGAEPLTALLWGMWLHAEAGRILTERVGRVGFLARELPDLIPGLLPVH
jgi:hypothetical protein